MGCEMTRASWNDCIPSVLKRIAALAGEKAWDNSALNFRRVLVMLASAVITLALLSIPTTKTHLLRLEESLGSLAWTLAPVNTAEERVVIVAIDERSLAEVGQWPWARKTMAKLTNRIDAAGAQLQIHDIVYAGESGSDLELSQALSNARNAIIAHVPVLEANQTEGLESEKIRSGVLSSSLDGLSCEDNPSIMASQDYLAPHSNFSKISSGHIAPLVNADGSITKLPAVVCIDQQAYPALSISALMKVGPYSDRPEVKLETNTGLLGPDSRLTLSGYPGFVLPLDKSGSLRISYDREPQNFTAVAAADVLAGRIDKSLFDNAWVLVGVTAFGVGDIVPTPYSGITPGVELQARLLSSFLDATIPYTPKNSAPLLASISLVFAIAILAIMGMQNTRLIAFSLPALAIFLPLLAFAIHAYLLRSSHIWLGWIAPAIYSMLSCLLLWVLDHNQARHHRDRLLANLSSFLPEELALKIAFSSPSSGINADRRDFTLLSADLRNFSAFGESRAPEEAAAVLHYFFHKASEIIGSHGGTVYEFKGDSVLALWESQSADAARNALHAAQAMINEIDRSALLNLSLADLEPLRLGIGIEQGKALFGTLGPSNRRTQALLGDAVTIALRIQELTADLGESILIGERAARLLGEESLKSQGSFLLDGLTTPHFLFSISSKEERLGNLSDLQETSEQQANAQPKLRLLSGGRHS